MNTNDKALELKVGMFVIFGLLVIAAMVLEFGHLSEYFQKTYLITVQLPNADGLIKDADVKLAGTRIGGVAETPKISPGVSGVRVLLKINGDIAIPKATNFQVGSTGLLGDKFVEIIASKDFDPEKFNPKDQAQIIRAGDLIIGVLPQTGLDALTRTGQVVMDKLNAEIDELKITTSKINDGILSDTNQKNLAGMLENLKTTSASFVETSKNIGTVVQGAQGVVDGAKQAIGTANTAMNTVNTAAGDLRITMEEARKTMTTAKILMQKATQGEGLIPTLLNNRELADNIKALIANLRERGVLFYKDVTAEQAKQKQSGTQQQAH